MKPLSFPKNFFKNWLPLIFVVYLLFMAWLGVNKCYGQDTIRITPYVPDTTYSLIYSMRFDTISHDISYDTSNAIFLVSDTSECSTSFLIHGIVIHRTEFIIVNNKWYGIRDRYIDSEYYYDRNYCALEKKYIIWNHQILSKLK